MDHRLRCFTIMTVMKEPSYNFNVIAMRYYIVGNTYGEAGPLVQKAVVVVREAIVPTNGSVVVGARGHAQTLRHAPRCDALSTRSAVDVIARVCCREVYVPPVYHMAVNVLTL